MSQTILITGAAGMLAWDLQREAARVFGSANVHALGRSELDIISESSVQSCLEKYHPTWVLNAAAYTNVDGAESESVQARAVNGEGPALLAETCHGIGARLLHFSTDQVFDGSGERPWTEEDVPSPINAYGFTKWQGEKGVLAFNEHLVLRVQWLYGEKKDRFTALKEKDSFTPFVDQFGAPTWTRDIAQIAMQLVQKNASGIYHFAYDDSASWAQVFGFVKQEWGLTLQLQPRKTSDVVLPARRPLNSRLDNAKLKEFLGRDSLGSWKTSLSEFLRRG